MPHPMVPDSQALARQRAQLIMQVRSGVMTAEAAARQLGISRKTYYKWERRALTAMVAALGNRDQGRPPCPTTPRRKPSGTRPRNSRRSSRCWSRPSGSGSCLADPGKKNPEVAAMVVTTLTDLKRQVRWSDARLCLVSWGCGTAASDDGGSAWLEGQPVRFRPGPKKVVPLAPRGAARGPGSTAPWPGAHPGRRHAVSADAAQSPAANSRALITTARRAHGRGAPGGLLPRHLAHTRPGLGAGRHGAARYPYQILCLHQVQDLASRYKFLPCVGERIVGEAVAERLEQLFVQHGPPLVLKRDNGGNLNQEAVDVVLARYWVVPLNSPRQYPPYNGGMERAIREVKAPLRAQLHASGPTPAAEVQHWAERLAYDLNHRPRRALQGQVACRVFQDARPVLQAYTPPQAKGGLR